MALTYFFAFYSLYGQVIGLFGKNGIQPVLSDFKLKSAASLGIAVSILAFVGIAQPLCLLIAFLLYLLFYHEGYPFLSFQWDALLVETGFIAFFYSLVSPPPVMLQIALWMLLFRLILSSGIVKWRSGCPSWHSFCAMDYHFETQPLPNFGGFLAFQWVKKFSRISVYIVFFFEILVPFLFFGTPLMRLIGAGLSIFFQLAIMATGNYAFFNILTIALCIPLIGEMHPVSDSIPLNIVGTLFLLYGCLILVKQFLVPRLNFYGLKQLRNYGLLNTYGLFAYMTTIRDEIIVEGSLDGKEWKEYVFKYKPGLKSEGVKQIAPFHPRLDWQMWFAALGDYRSHIWFQNFVAKLLQNSKDVLSLLKENPFPDSPPKYVRAERYRFTFCSFEEWRKTGKYWNKQYVGKYYDR